MHSREEATLRLEKSGTGPVTAGDIKLDHDVEIVNPDLVLANLTGGKLNVTLKVTRGRGYVPAVSTEREEEVRGVGVLKLDAHYRPVRRGSHAVEREGGSQGTGLERLTQDGDPNGGTQRSAA